MEGQNVSGVQKWTLTVEVSTGFGWCLFSDNESGLTDKLFVRRLRQPEMGITLITLFSADTEIIGYCTTESL